MAERNRAGVLPSLLVTAGVVAVAAIVGWLLLLLLKGIVVLGTYVLGIALIVLPLLLARRIVGQSRGRERRRRVLGIASAVALGALLCAVANLVDDNGWLLIAIPAGLVLVERVLDRFQDRRRRR